MLNLTNLYIVVLIVCVTACGAAMDPLTLQEETVGNHRAPGRPRFSEYPGPGTCGSHCTAGAVGKMCS